MTGMHEPAGRPAAGGPTDADRAGSASGGLLMGRLFGVPIFVAPSWFLVAALITWSFAPTVSARVPAVGEWRYVVAFAFAVLLYLSVLVHELSHSVVALRLGMPVRRISLHLLGGVSEIEQEAQSPGREFLVAAAGPAVSLLLGALCLLPAGALERGTVSQLLADVLARTNFIVGIFNLLPGLPLDGGRVVHATVWRITGRRYTGIVAAAWSGRVLAGLLIALPLLLGPARGRPVSTVGFLWTLLIASFIWLGATEALRVATVRERLPRLQVRALTRRALPVAADLPLSEAIRRAGEIGARGLVVVDGAGRPFGLVSEAAVAATPAERRPWVPVGSLARRLEDGLVVSAELRGEDLVRMMQRVPATEYLVVESSGEIYGVLATADVERAFAATAA